MRTIALITSKAAQKHLNEIKVKHAELLKKMEEHSARIKQENQQRKTESDTKQEADRQFNQKQSEINAKSYGKFN
jgi:siroheme synthase (precorrin-2 oxidase/ferrochelatase)